MISVIIPAHNEQQVIERCLRAISSGARRGELQIIVVCNGCSDRTADVARSAGGPVEVLVTAIASKSLALNMGDEAARGFPRFYIDADVVVSLETIRRVADVLREDGVLAAAPRMRVTLEGSSWAVRAYYEIWMRLPYHLEGMIGSGFYAASKEGRHRFTSFPDIISDDGFFRLQFSPDERTAVEGCYFEVTPPTRISDLIQIKTRSQFGKYQLHRRFPELLANDPRSYRGACLALLKQPRLWPRFMVYSFVLYTARLKSLWRLLARSPAVWDRDDSSRR